MAFFRFRYKDDGGSRCALLRPALMAIAQMTGAIIVGSRSPQQLHSYVLAKRYRCNQPERLTGILPDCHRSSKSMCDFALGEHFSNGLPRKETALLSSTHHSFTGTSLSWVNIITLGSCCAAFDGMSYCQCHGAYNV
jgi:hypothetical protein